MRRFVFIGCLLLLGCDKAATKSSGGDSKDSASAEAKTDKPSEPMSDAVIEFKKLEDTIPVSDTGVKYQITVTGTKGPKISAATSSLIAVYKDGDSEKSDLLATETDDGSSWSPEDNPFPGAVGTDWHFGGMVFMDDAKNADLQKLYAQRESNGLKLMLKVELKSTGGAIKPVEREITLDPPKG